MVLLNETNDEYNPLKQKADIKKELIDHNDRIKSQIDYRAQKLLKIINNENIQNETNEKIIQSESNEIIESIIYKINLKLVDLIEKISDQNLKEIDDYFEKIANTNNSFKINREEIKRIALKNYLIYLEGNDLKYKVKDKLINPNLGLLIEYKCYPTENQLIFLRNKLCEKEQNEICITYDQELILDENSLATFLERDKNDDLIENHILLNNDDKSWLEKTLEFRNDYNFNIESIAIGAFKLFRNLKSLKLDDCRCIKTLLTGSFDGLDNLKLLSLAQCNIHKIEPNCFFGLTNLQSLYLSFNLFDFIDSYQFNGLNNLTSLHLNNLELKSIESNAFSCLSNLNFLNLSFSDVKFLSKDAFNGLENLNLLDLVYATFEEIEQENSFLNMKNLKKIFVDTNSFLNYLPYNLNQISQIEMKFTSNDLKNDLSKIKNRLLTIKSLETLDLSAQNAQITFDELFKMNFFDQFVHLKHLIMSRCKIKIIDENAFDAMENLETLDLSFNALTGEYFDKLFKNLHNLKKLDLSGNSIKKIKANYFIGLVNLREISLRSCKLESIECQIFETSLSNLKHLNLNMNKSIKSKTINNLSRLHKLKKLEVLF